MRPLFGYQGVDILTPCTIAVHLPLEFSFYFESCCGEDVLTHCTKLHLPHIGLLPSMSMALNITGIPTEQTSAITDLILAGQSMVCFYLVRRRPANQCFALSLWAWIFGLLSFSSLLGAFVHGFELSSETVAILWCPLYFALGQLVALVALAAIAHFGYQKICRSMVPASIGLAFVFAAVTQVWSNSFLLFVAYEALMMTFALGIYITCLWHPTKQRGSGLLALGVFLTLMAAAVDTQSTWRLQCIWAFDNHGIFHLIQMSGLSIISFGLIRTREPILNAEADNAKR